MGFIMRSKKVLVTVAILILGIGAYLGVSAWRSYAEEQKKQNQALAYENIDLDYLNHQTDFSFDIFQRLAESEENESLMISPLSINYALYMVYNGSDGNTKKEMEEALYLNGIEPEKLNEQVKHLSDYLSYSDLELQIANSIWGREGRVELKDDFQNKMNSYYDAKIEQLDFNDDGASKIINDWVYENTGEKIDEMVPNNIPPSVVMYLINAIYFYGNWDEPFPEEDTREDVFVTQTGEQITIDMMRHKEEFSYMENDLFQAVSLLYEDNKYQMTLFLPDEEKNLAEFYQELNIDKWNKWKEQFYSVEGEVKLPRFELEYEVVLNDVLQEMGMEKAFQGSADFSDLMYDSSGIFISEVLHKTFIEVDEEGTEAAAATSVVMEEAAAPVESFKIKFDRPFFFVIENTDLDTVLFMGAVEEPV